MLPLRRATAVRFPRNPKPVAAHGSSIAEIEDEVDEMGARLDDLEVLATTIEAAQQVPFRILDLPTELHHEIINCAPASSAVNLKLTCRRLYQCGPPLTILYYLARKDPNLRFDLTCSNERALKRYREKVACSSCLTFHHPWHFAQDQLKMGDWQRKCVGSQLHIRFVPDGHVSYQSLARVIPGSGCGIDVTLRQTQNQYIQRPVGATFLDFPYTRGKWRIQRGKRMNKFSHVTDLYCTWNIDIDRLPEMSTSLQTLVDQLAQNPVGFCPHIFSHHQKFAEGVRFVQGYPWRTRDVLPLYWPKLKCTACQTTIILNWREDYNGSRHAPRGRGVVEIRIRRRIGSTKHFSATDTHWIAQTEPPETFM